MAAFDAAPKTNEKSAFDDGDVGSDLSDDDDAPAIGGVQGNNGAVKMNIAGMEFGSMSVRNRNLVEEEKKEAVSLSDVNNGSPLQHQISLPPAQDAGDKEGGNPDA